MKTLEIEVKEPVKLLDFIAETFPGSSRTKQKEILQHRILIKSRRVTQFDFQLEKGMVVTIVGDENRGKLMQGKMDIVYEDHYLMVVNKPVGLLSSSSNPKDVTVITEINDYFINRHSRQRAHVVHRLDRDTSGLLLVAKSKEVSRELELNWKEKVFDRAYVAVTWGAPVPAFGTVRSWLSENEYCVVSSPIEKGDARVEKGDGKTEKGKLAITHYKTLKKKGRFALVQLQLETGRRNQIRVHMREMGHPLLKDPIYGFRDDNSPLKRLALHAFKLCFHHPVTGKEIRLETPFPKEFTDLFN